MVKRLAYLALFLIAFNFLEHFAHKKTDGFSLQRIQFAAPLLQGNSEQLPELNQPFHYLDCGNQCYAFVSEDSRYVLKFFKYAKPSVPRFFTTLPVLNHFKPFRPHRFEKQLWKRERDFHGYQLAYNSFREETGLIAVHLDPIHHNYPTITLIDKLHCAHALDLNCTPFILQRKAIPIYKQLRAWVASGQTGEAKLGIASLINLLKKRMANNLQDDDVHFYSNFGFIGNQAIQLDPGHFIQGTVPNPELEMKTITSELTVWCGKHAPSLLFEVEHE
jgi:hypothetical protein